MSRQIIHQYYNQLSRCQRYSGTRNESSIRRAFFNLLEDYCQSKNLELAEEVPLPNSRKRPDGTVKDALCQDWGYWESKDVHDDLDAEIAGKFEIGYPKSNIIFENSREIVLWQQEKEVLRGPMQDENLLHEALSRFVSWERPEVREFREAVERFKQDIPDIVESLRSLIAEQLESNVKFRAAKKKFRELCQDSINPEITVFDVREMLIQHMLTSEIFDTVFGDSHFHRENNIAAELETVISTFFTGTVRRNALADVEGYYRAIRARASQIENHHEKQKFLKVIYENFYKAYNPKGADRLGIVYTPNEIVHFMIESTDFLLEKHFGKTLSDKNVEILDPATGTGTFITDIIEYIPPQYLEYKYKKEIHANELAILPYYIANLNIEYTYQQKMKQYEPFKNIVFVDTLDNLGFSFKGKQGMLDGFGLSAENLERIIKQNEKNISVIIGNPPYNANQMNENDNNKNREYPQVDKRIKDTYIKESTAQKTKLYDMYSRFYRWASDRISDDGIIAFITNNSFVNARTFDGFRKCIQSEFDYAYIIDLGGNIRELSGKDGIYLNEKHTIFGVSAAVGIAMMFLVKNAKDKNKKCKIQYIHPCDIRATRREKLEFLNDNPFRQIAFEAIAPDKNNNWINITDNDFETLIPLANKKKSVFGFYTNGVNTARDEWVFAIEKNNLIDKIQFFISIFNKTTEIIKDKKNLNQLIDYSIKWSESLKNLLFKFEKNKKLKLKFNSEIIKSYNYRPFFKVLYYAEIAMSDRMTNNHLALFGEDISFSNKLICISGNSISKPFQNLVVDKLFSFDFLEKTQCLPLYRYESDGSRTENITDWGLKQFTAHYKDDSITKEDIFHYTYAVLHNPAYRRKYEINLKREFPRLPFYKNFRKWADQGRALMDLHIHYETAQPFDLKTISPKKLKDAPKPKLKSDPEKGMISLDENTTLDGIPEIAWEYKLGNRSALDWILDQYREKKPKDPTILEKFNTYRFADYRETVIDLLKRVCTVSVKTMEIVQQMEEEEGHRED